MKNIYLFLGLSGVGKTSVVDELSKKYGYKVLKSYTTRPKRTEEDDDHIYITEDDYNKLDKDKIIAYTKFMNNHYFATIDQIDENDLYVIDEVGLDMIHKQYKGNKKIKSILIRAGELDRKYRMRHRGDKDEYINDRLYVDDLRINILDNIEFDLEVYNIFDLSDTCNKINSFIVEEESK